MIALQVLYTKILNRKHRLNKEYNGLVMTDDDY